MVFKTRFAHKALAALLLSAPGLIGCSGTKGSGDAGEVSGDTAADVGEVPIDVTDLADASLDGADEGQGAAIDATDIFDAVDPLEVDVAELEGFFELSDEDGEVKIVWPCGSIDPGGTGISGTVYYDGPLPDHWTLSIHIFAGKEEPSNPVGSPQGAVHCAGNPAFPKLYAIDTKTPGTYWVKALVDFDDDQDYDFAVLYLDPIEVVSGQVVTGIDIYLE